MTADQAIYFLNKAHQYSLVHSGCKKVNVGSVIVFSNGTETDYYPVSYGANVTVPDLCKSTECMRVQKYGEDSKNHRLPSDCRAIHSEIDAIINVEGSVRGCTIVVTRYPCEACARAIIAAGITRVVYGRKQKISEETKNMFDSYGVEVIHVDSWDQEDTTR